MMNDEHSSEHSDIISRDDGYSPDVVPAMGRTINGHVYTEAQYQQMCAEHPMYYVGVDRNPTQVESENEQLRALVSSSLLLMLDMGLDLIGEFGVWHQAQKFTVIREQAKTLGIEVQE